MSLLDTFKRLLGLGPKTADLSKGDRMLTCMDCEKEFVFDAGEQQFFKQKDFTNPKHYPHCRKKVRSRMRKRGRGRDRGDRGDRGERGHHKGHSFARKHSVIDGDSPYTDKR
jgi:hypothetical protein